MFELSREPELAERQIQAITYYLTTCGYIDDEFDLREKAFVRALLRRLVTARVDAAGADIEPELRFELIEREHEHYLEAFGEIDLEVRGLFTEAVADGEDPTSFVVSRLTLRCFELLSELSPENRTELINMLDEFIRSDGQVHPEEQKFRNELATVLGRAEATPSEADVPCSVEIGAAVELPSAPADHPFFAGFEHHYASDPEQIRPQIDADLRLLDQAEVLWTHQRELGQGRLAGNRNVGELAGAPFLDRFVYAVPPTIDGDFELIVLGDLHGCYSCLKAAVMQSNFMEKVRAFRADPQSHPDVRLVLLGDYIDRGRFAFNGVLRAVLKLLLTVPEHVFMLRGNHEYYIEYQGRVYSGVKPADTINALSGLLPDTVFERYLRFFDGMPSLLLFDRMMFVHGGIPRDALIAERLTDLASLNDEQMRFQMLWSDPSRAETVPDELQNASARFGFGRQQFRSFMDKIGCTLLVRGHEKINAGFRDHYPRDDKRLLTVFSAGGVANDDLPADSNYRDVRPMALTITRQGGETKVTPWAIDYRSYQDPDRNAFFRLDPTPRP